MAVLPLVIFSLGPLYSQNKGNILAKLNSSIHDTIRIALLNSLAKSINNDPDSAEMVFKQAKSLSFQNLSSVFFAGSEKTDPSKSAYLRLLAQTYLNLASQYRGRNLMKEAQLNNDSSYHLMVKLENKRGQVYCLLNYGDIQSFNGNIPKAIEYYDEGIAMAERAGIKDALAQGLTSAGILQNKLRNGKTARNLWHQARNIQMGLKNEVSVTINMSNIGGSFMNEKRFDSALYYFQQVIPRYEGTNQLSHLAAAYNNMAIVYQNLKKNEQAMEMLLKCLDLREKTKDWFGTTTVKLNLGGMLIENKEYRRAEMVLTECLRSAEKTDHHELKFHIYSALYNLYDKTGRMKEAFEMNCLFMDMHDTMISENNKKAAYKSRLKYEFQKKILTDSIESAQEKKLSGIRIAESKARLEQERTTRYVLFGGLSLSLLLSILIFNRFKLVQKQKSTIEEQKKRVDAQQKKTTDSIRYAKRIQNSVLPAREEIAQHFADHSVLFIPKDIVSGDLYWFHHDRSYSYIAVADCTGHGVPGAFLTLIANAALIETVVEKKISEPGKILENLHEIIFKGLQQHKAGEYSQDGMDISLAVIDHAQRLLYFSGARNHAYLLDAGAIRELKADPKSIGGLSILGEIEPKRTFKTSTHQLEKETMLVMCTDGIADQLGPSDEKFGTLRLKEILAAAKDPETFTTELMQRITAWRQDNKQIDDMLVLCIRTSPART